MDALKHILQAHSWPTLVLAIVDIVLVYYIVYRALLLIKGTKAVQMLVGLLAIIIFSFASREEYLNLPTLHWLLETFLGSFILIIIVIFQEDIRRGLSQVGKTSLFSDLSTRVETQLIEEIVQASTQMANKKYGALIAIEREANLGPHLETGTTLDAQVSKELLCAIFIPERENPLHDGAVIIRDDRLRAAGVFLPLTSNPSLDQRLGTRHRAALGLSEETDAAIIVVSEETGLISVAYREELIRGLDATTLREVLYRIFRYQNNKDTEPQSVLDRLKRSSKKESPPDKADPKTTTGKNRRNRKNRKKEDKP